MCGIAGVLAFRRSDFRATDAYVTRMRETLASRGPDGARTWVSPDGAVGLGFRRLAIVDLDERAMQPMANETGDVRLVFNGEIYNHLDLRRELEATGRHVFRTDHSDTETIVHAYEEWGIGCLERLRGMFALAIWDARSRELWLARDRIGIKPLFYARRGDRLAFGSELPAILSDPEQPRRLDAEAAYHYLSFLTAPAPLTFYEGIAKLPPATWLRVREDGSCEERCWWDPWDHVEPLLGRSDDELAGRVLDELRVSVELRKMSDVPVGIFLSGGIDSSTNAALFAGHGSAVQTFSIGYDADYASYPSELPYARLMADVVAADHHERIVSEADVLDFLPQLVRIQGEPIADPVAVPLYFVSELARRSGAVVCQAGEGADELFWGYPSWRTHLRLQRAHDLAVPRSAKRLGLKALALAGRADTRPFEFLRRGSEGVPVFWGGAEAFTESQKRRLAGPALLEAVGDLSSWEALAPIRRRFEEAAWEPSHLHWMSYLDLRLRLPELLLARIDRMSMAAGVEVRVPFLDHRFVELALSIPSAAKTRGGELKHLLKHAVRGVIPDELVDRPKQGFRMPVEEWFRERLGDRARLEVGAFARESELLDPVEVGRLLERPGRSAWYLLNLALWWREAGIA
ncbi:MAG TPA: asparagine synthase (glutamine-hydrolyzing) [Gaiellaceae bacterium]|nr:asparagine synthase (glutamine-hydrolyzing) [Gaiellaceae bacterium]